MRLILGTGLFHGIILWNCAIPCGGISGSDFPMARMETVAKIT